MTLSEAIRAGAQMRPRQAFYQLYDSASEGTCALGAAAEAIGILDKENSSYTGKAPVEWKPVAKSRQRCPECRVRDDLQGCIRHLNNVHRWSREHIADWVHRKELKVKS